MRAVTDVQRAEVERLRAQVAGLERDAARWEWCEAHLLQECADEYWLDMNGRDLRRFVDDAIELAK